MSDLESALQRFRIELPAPACDGLRRYCTLLWDHNQRINLTRHTDWDQFVSRDLVDTLQLSALIRSGERILDIGSGGGVPGMVLALLRPDLKVTLCESVGKKARVLAAMVTALGIDAEVFDLRAETLLEDLRFDACTARAVGPLDRVCRWFDGKWYAIGRLLAVKGPRWEAELEAARGAGLLKGVRAAVAARYPVPGQEWQGIIVKLWPIQLPEPGPNLVQAGEA